MPSRFFKEQPTKRDNPSHAEVRRAKDFWEAILEQSIVAQLDESSTAHASAVDVVRFAGELADAALMEMEKRWPKI